MGRVSYLLRVVAARPSRHARRGRDRARRRPAATSSASTSSSAGRAARSTTSWSTLPPGGLADRLITARSRSPASSSSRCGPTSAAPTCTATSSWSTRWPADPARGARAAGGRRRRGVFRAGWAVVVEDGRRSPCCREPGARRTSTGWTLPWLPLRGAAPDGARARTWVPERWAVLGIELAARRWGGRRARCWSGRTGGPRFRRSEVLRLAHLAGIAATVSGR